LDKARQQLAFIKSSEHKVPTDPVTERTKEAAMRGIQALAKRKRKKGARLTCKKKWEKKHTKTID
jgi:hypothetical protein